MGVPDSNPTPNFGFEFWLWGFRGCPPNLSGEITPIGARWDCSTNDSFVQNPKLASSYSYLLFSLIPPPIPSFFLSINAGAAAVEAVGMWSIRRSRLSIISTSFVRCLNRGSHSTCVLRTITYHYVQSKLARKLWLVLKTDYIFRAKLPRVSIRQ